MDAAFASPAPVVASGAAGGVGFDLDRVRATLMLLGIALHSADVFVTAGNWLVADAQRSAVFDAMVALIHSFRVPGFFLLSGLLFARSLGRHAVPELLSRQLLRLGLPLLVCWALLNGAQQALLAWQRGGDPWLAWLSPPPMYHLWFLRDLLVLDLLVLAAAALMGGSMGTGTGVAATAAMAETTHRASGRFAARLSRALDTLAARGSSHWSLVAVTGTLFSLALLLGVRLTGRAYAVAPGGLSLFNIAFHAPLFLAGLAMSHRPAWLNAWLRTPLWTLPLAALAAAWGEQASDTLRHALAREVALAVQLLGIWIATGAVVGALGHLRSAQPGHRSSGSRLGRALIGASYTIFLVHHLLVVVLALLLLPLAWPAAVKFALIVGGALALSLAFHRWAVQPFAVMRLLFNGRALSAPAERPARAAAGRA